MNIGYFGTLLIKNKILTRLTIAFTILLVQPIIADEAVKGVQQVLKDCGFNPGPVDGIWGGSSVSAARQFVMAHGLTPSSIDDILFVQADSFRVGDSGPCPDTQPAQAKAVEGGPVEPVVTESDQAEQVEVASSPYAEIAELLEQPLSEDDNRRGWVEDQDYDFVYGSVTRVSENGTVLTYYYGGGGASVTFTKFSLSDIESMEVPEMTEHEKEQMRQYQKTVEDMQSLYYFCKEGIQCSRKIKTFFSHGTEEAVHDFKILVEKNGESDVWEDEDYGYSFSAHESGQLPDAWRSGRYVDYHAVVAAFDRIKETGNQQAGQALQCYNWASLGTFNIGKWKNGHGQETGGLLVGSNDELYDDDELWESYDHYHNGKIVLSTCEGAANDARDNAVSAMIRIGRKADDVENEKRRITDFYQDNLLKCQSHFKRLYGKYKGRFCGDQQMTNRDMSIDADFEK